MLPVRLGVILVLTSFTFLFLHPSNATELGTTRIESYLVNSTIESRFARTNVKVTFRNGGDCSALRGFTLQLPLNARVSWFSMILSDGCELNSKLASEEDAKKSFKAQVEAGTPAAMLTAWDSSNYRVDVFIPPLGHTSLELQYEELLVRRQHKVLFQLPISPGVEVERLELDVFISEPQTGVSKFSLEDPGYGNFRVARGANTAKGHLELSDVSSSALPRLIRGEYDTENFPENGILMADGYGCATLLFNPTNFLQTGSMPRNIVFVIDVSGSMSGVKLRDAKAAFSTMITTLVDEDHFAIHSFSNTGKDSVFKSRAATSDAKSDALAFVNDLIAGGGTNLRDAYTHGLHHVMTMEQNSDQDREYVPVLVILTDGQATAGETVSQKISQSVRAKNEINAKIFALAFGFGADLSLLLGISVQNGGMAIPIYEGFGDAAQQMEGFFLGELGEVLMSDLEVGFSGDFGILEQTRTKYPVFARGGEIVARAMMAAEDFSRGTLQATTKANTVVGERVWTTELDMETVIPTLNSECAIGLAHARIAEIMEFREGALSLGNDLAGYEPYQQTGQLGSSVDKAEEAKQEALEVALEKGVVWPGLTAIVTVQGSKCDITASTNYCTDGDNSDSDGNVDIDEESADMGAQAPAGAPPGTSAPGTGATGSKQNGGGFGAGANARDSYSAEGDVATVRDYSEGCSLLAFHYVALAVSLVLALVLLKH